MCICTEALALTVDRMGNCPEDVRIQGTDYFTIVSGPDIFTSEDSTVLVDSEISDQLPMHTRLHKIRESRNRTFFMTKRKLNDGQRVCGWMRAKPIRDADPTTLEDAISVLAPRITVGNLIEWTDPITNAIQRLENPLPLKALLRTNPELDTDNAALTRIYDRPVRSSWVRAGAKAFGVYYIYSERLLDEDIWYWIAGSEPSVKTRYAGWVPESQVILWGGQLSLYWNDATEATGIYLDARAARQAQESGIVVSRSDGFIERSTGSPGGYMYNFPRFPIIDRYESDQPGEKIFQIAYLDAGTVREGFVRYNERAKNYALWVDLSQQQLEMLQIIFRNVCRGFDRGNVRRQLERAMLQVQHAFSLDEDYSADTPLGLYLRRFLFLPSQHFLGFLESTPDRIADVWEDARQKDNGGFEFTGPIADPVCRSAKLLDLVLDSKRVEDINYDIQPSRLVDDRATYAWSVADDSKVHDFDWEVVQSGEMASYYIPVEYLPARGSW